ncbi:late competence protein ComER [Bacillus kwashiorkori]|uniref:late competence protein ComER n=1 Tax=Bacillus kwashiorkori TaxID=1522318 RepID=UPI00078369C6|nr:late competence protein ComER [Bacillus kwashiorkori]
MRIGIIGTGNMGSILLEAFMDSGAIPQKNMFITNRTLSRAKQFQERYPQINVGENAEIIAKECELIFICIKPLDIHPLLMKINPLLNEQQCVVSITSPISVAQLESVLPCSCIRAIPSITNRSLSGVSLLTFGQYCSSNWITVIKELLGKISKTVDIDEDITRVASDIVSCGPAFFSFLVQKFVQAAVHETKITEEEATLLVSEMLIGLGQLLEKNYYTLQTLQKKVCVKGGVTGEGIKVLEEANLDAVFQKLFQKTHEKYYEDIAKVTEQFQS